MKDGYKPENLTILVKTKPTPTKRNGALVCTAGINQHDEWRRIYPIRWENFFQSNDKTKFKKWDVINVPTIKAKNDQRMASYHISDYNDVQIVNRINNRRYRAGIIKRLLCHGVECLWGNSVERSLAIIKPKRITSIYYRESTSDNCIMPKSEAKPDIIPDIVFRYKCNNPDCKTYHNMICIDWEFTETLRKNINEYGEIEGEEKTSETIFNLIKSKDIYFVLGNSWDYFRFPKKWFIVGIMQMPIGSVSEWEW